MVKREGKVKNGMIIGRIKRWNWGIWRKDGRKWKKQNFGHLELCKFPVPLVVNERECQRLNTLMFHVSLQNKYSDEALTQIRHVWFTLIKTVGFRSYRLSKFSFPCALVWYLHTLYFPVEFPSKKLIINNPSIMTVICLWYLLMYSSQF